jgi:hypothetical protein
MIVFVRGRLEASSDAERAIVDAAEESIVARIYASAGRPDRGDDVVAARTTLHIGVADHERTALLGSWPADGPDPAGPLGLASAPVVLLPDASLASLALAGITRAGRSPHVATADVDAPALGLALLDATSSGADVVVVPGADGRHLDLVRILGGRAIVALPLPDVIAVRSWLADAELDAELPIPTTQDAGWSAIAPLGLEATHQLVQVDPTPALDEAGAPAARATPAMLAAAAAGVLAGRIADGNRRWRAGLE